MKTRHTPDTAAAAIAKPTGTCLLMLALLAALAMALPLRAEEASPMALREEVHTRQALIQVALAREPADLIISNVTLLNVFTGEWQKGQDIVVLGERIAWVGATGTYSGKAKKTIDASGEWAVPGFGESHKHIESSYLTPEYEAALVIPRGNTWTVEGSHEMSNVIGEHNVDFWLMAEDAGSPLKIFPAVGSATPPTVYERGGGYYGYDEMHDFLAQDLRVVALGEVMDWPAVSNPGAPGSQRIWEMIQATWDQRGVVEGHGSGLRSIAEINAFAAAGLSSDHEVRLADEGLEKVRRGVFLEVRTSATRPLFEKLLELGIEDWSNISVTTDDRDVAATVQLGSMDYNIRLAIEAGVPAKTAYMMGSFNTARHFNVDHLVGAIAPGRYADVVLLDNPETVSITRVFANGRLASKGSEYLLPIPEVTYPDWAYQTMSMERKVTARDFEIMAPVGRETVDVALMEPFYFAPEFIRDTMPVTDGKVLPDTDRGIVKVAVTDRYRGETAVSKMFWRNVGPKTPGSALASSQMHDIHNIWAVGNDDAAMALAVNTVAELDGGWALVSGGKVVATVRLDIGGLMTARPVEEVAKEVEALFAAADAMEWIGSPGLPERMRFAFLTASPWKWQLVAPYEGNPGGFVNVTTGQTHPVVW
ncbi:MAG: adenine deaminase C-terminal domain-containing protein [Halieaceae bacterium]|jgi:adenine deaminase|nr:adenine deaminase C-terminal domain-containing protein [Halieaceae bacterium]